MAIIIKNEKTSMLEKLWENQWERKTGEPLRRTINLAWDFNGDITLNGQNPGVLDLGNIGDDYATVVKINAPEGKNYNNYKGYIYYRWSYDNVSWIDADDPISLVDSEGNNQVDTFYITSDLTKDSMYYEFIYVLREDSVGSIRDEEEVFVSSVFRGFVNSSLYWSAKSATLVDPVELEDQIQLAKRSVLININGDKKPIISSTGSSILGYEYDRYMTRILIEGFASDVECAVLFQSYTNNVNILAIANKDDNGKIRVWIPPQVTEQAGVYSMMVVAYDENGSELYSDTLRMEVVGNFLSQQSSPDFSDVVFDANERIVYVLADEAEE